MFEVLNVTFLSWCLLFTDIRVNGNAKRPERRMLQYVYVRVLFECVRALVTPANWIILNYAQCTLYVSRDMTKQTKWLCSQRRLRSAWASAQSEQSSLSAWRKLGSFATQSAHSEDSDQTGRMPRLIWVFAGTQSFCWFCHVLARVCFSCGSV